jgi:hypothetical protein
MKMLPDAMSLSPKCAEAGKSCGRGGGVVAHSNLFSYAELPAQWPGNN